MNLEERMTRLEDVVRNHVGDVNFNKQEIVIKHLETYIKYYLSNRTIIGNEMPADASDKLESMGFKLHARGGISRSDLLVALENIVRAGHRLV